MSDIFNELFDLPTVANAAGASPVTVKSWIAKGHVTGQGPRGRLEGGGRQGRHLGFGFNTVIETGIAKTILDHGQDNLAWAFSAAFAFAHLGQEAGELPRQPGFPYRESGVVTLLFVAGPNGLVRPWWPRGRDSEGRPTPDAIGTARAHFGRPEGFVTIDCDLAFHRIVRGLGRDPNEVMQAAYGGTR